MTTSTLYLFTETPVHAGGPESLGGIDLPIQREVATGFPTIWGQSLRGALRALVASDDRDLACRLFGGDPESASKNGITGTDPGNVFIGDLRLVALPVSTTRRTFAWVTSNLCLDRLARIAGSPTVPFLPSSQGFSVGLPWEGATVLGPYRVDLRSETEVGNVARHLSTGLPTNAGFNGARLKLATDLVVVDDATLKALSRECVEVVTRVKLKENKTVENLFVEEYLPSETLLATSISSSASAADTAKLHDLMQRAPWPLGGSTGTGKGLVWATVRSGAVS